MRRLIAWLRHLIKGDQEFVIMSGEEVLNNKPNPWDEYRPRSIRNVIVARDAAGVPITRPSNSDCAPDDKK